MSQATHPFVLPSMTRLYRPDGGSGVTLALMGMGTDTAGITITTVRHHRHPTSLNSGASRGSVSLQRTGRLPTALATQRACCRHHLQRRRRPHQRLFSTGMYVSRATARLVLQVISLVLNALRRASPLRQVHLRDMHACSAHASLLAPATCRLYSATKLARFPQRKPNLHAT